VIYLLITAEEQTLLSFPQPDHQRVGGNVILVTRTTVGLGSPVPLT